MSTIRLETTDQRARRLADEIDDELSEMEAERATKRQSAARIVRQKHARVAQASTAAVWANCAECGGPLTDAAGSQLLVLGEIPVGHEFVCPCGQVNRLPKRFASDCLT